jgi:hypothetical protein
VAYERVKPTYLLMPRVITDITQGRSLYLAVKIIYFAYINFLIDVFPTQDTKACRGVEEKLHSLLIAVLHVSVLPHCPAVLPSLERALGIQRIAGWRLEGYYSPSGSF